MKKFLTIAAGAAAAATMLVPAAHAEETVATPAGDIRAEQQGNGGYVIADGAESNPGGLSGYIGVAGSAEDGGGAVGSCSEDFDPSDPTRDEIDPAAEGGTDTSACQP